MNIIDDSFEKIIKKKNKLYIINEDVYCELIKVITEKPEMFEYLLISISNMLSSKPLKYNIQLFELIDRFFNSFKEFRLPFIKLLQKSTGILITSFQNQKQNSTEIKLRQNLISIIVNWNEKHGKSLPLINLCLNFIRSKFRKDVEYVEKRLQNKINKQNKLSQMNEHEKQRNHQHLLEVYRDNKIMINASLKTIETCFNLLVPKVTEIPTSPIIPLVLPVNEMSIFPGVNNNFDDLSIEFSGPSTKLKSRMIDDVTVDLSEDNMGIDIVENSDNIDVIRALKEEIGVLQRRYVPLLHNILKKLKQFDNTEKDRESVSYLSWNIIDTLKKFDKMKIIRNDSSSNLISSDSEQDDNDFIDVL